MINKKLAFMAIPVLAAILIGGSLSPAFAAQKFVDQNDVFVNSFGPFGGLCSPNPELWVFVDHFVIKIWDNGHAKFHLDSQVFFIDTVTGAVTGSGESVTNQSVQPGGLPFVDQSNFEFVCTDGSEPFGPSFSFGFTVDENGNFHNHGP